MPPEVVDGIAVVVIGIAVIVIGIVVVVIGIVEVVVGIAAFFSSISEHVASLQLSVLQQQDEHELQKSYKNAIRSFLKLVGRRFPVAN